jgi:putative transposase
LKREALRGKPGNLPLLSEHRYAVLSLPKENQQQEVAMERYYKFRIYPTAKQMDLIQKTYTYSCYIYNHYLDKNLELRQEGQPILDYNGCMKDLVQLKKLIVWLGEVDSTVFRSCLWDLSRAFENGQTRPEHRKVSQSSRSYQSLSNNSNIRIADSRLQMPKLGPIKIKGLQAIEGLIASAKMEWTDPKHCYAVLRCINLPEKTSMTKRAIGIDLGLKDLCITSDGDKVPRPDLDKACRRLKKEQSRLDRKPVDSRNAAKAQAKVDKAKKKIANKKLDYCHKISSRLVNQADVIVAEDLDIQAMLKNPRLYRQIRNFGWTLLIHQLSYKTRLQGKIFLQVSQYFPSSQICSACGQQNPVLKNLAVREWTCPQCQTRHDRDINAAINIRNEGLRVLGLARKESA